MCVRVCDLVSHFLLVALLVPFLVLLLRLRERERVCVRVCDLVSHFLLVALLVPFLVLLLRLRERVCESV